MSWNRNKIFLVLLVLIVGLGLSLAFVEKNHTSSENPIPIERLASSERVQLFEKELSLIESDEIRGITAKLIERLPDYYFVIPASSTGKYHPDYAQGKGGLVRHTKAAVGIATELFRLESYEDIQKDKDFIIAALILHDGLKCGENNSEGTKAEHPLLMANFIKQNTENNEIANKIADLVISHMGQWNTQHDSTEEIVPKPTTKAQKFVHLCDYLASRKRLEYNFNAD